jgi:hypothetical protein
MSDNQTRQITESIYYDDGQAIHACESAILVASPAGLDEVRHGRTRRSGLHGRGRGADNHLPGTSGGDWLAAHARRR